MSYAALDDTNRTFSDSNRTFTDASGRTWVAERVGRTSGIVAPGRNTPLPAPADIVRFSCPADPDEADRESTIRAGALGELTDDELCETLGKARTIRTPPS